MERADGKEIGDQKITTVEVEQGKEDLIDALKELKEKTIPSEVNGNAKVSFIEIEQVVQDPFAINKYAVVYREFYEPRD